MSRRTLEDAEKRIAALKERGVPDSSLSRAKVFLYQARDAKQRGNMGLARASADSMRILIAKAEDDYAKAMERLKPYLASMRGKFQKVRADLSGLHQARLDSMMNIIDSLTAMSWLIAAEAQANVLDSMLPRLEFDQNRAEELRSRLPGTWVCTQKTTHAEDKSVNAVEKKVFSFDRDGKAKLVENKKGKSSPFLKEDWEFRSWGTWDLLGDTIHLFIERFACTRQQFEEYHKKNGKVWWEKKLHPTYDSTITDGSQDRWITFADLKKDFVRR
ncbi:MAG: hypothetical protein GF418_03580 [Chitinivibrionales bacterium]|nr:hypothetical protein [Chitinivibrionales bacterium]MBD3394685.1 hypothetical protein [Chitinivibrionales bacterium]